MCSETGVAFELETAFPKLAALHRTMKADPKLAKYFASDPYKVRGEQCDVCQLQWRALRGRMGRQSGRGTLDTCRRDE